MLEHPLSWLLPYLDHYGSAALFVLLVLGIVILPIPDESLLVLSGWLIAKGVLPKLSTLCAAVGGAWCGISVSYLLGRNTGHYFTQKCGRYVGLSPQRVAYANSWFLRRGQWSLLIGYFIPGIRHLVGYIAGTLSFPYRKFALFAYLGGFVWVHLFLAIGYFFNAEWQMAMAFFHDHYLALLQSYF